MDDSLVIHVHVAAPHNEEVWEGLRAEIAWLIANDPGYARIVRVRPHADRPPDPTVIPD